MIGYWHNPVVSVVCLSVRLSVTLCIVALRVGVQGKQVAQLPQRISASVAQCACLSRLAN